MGGDRQDSVSLNIVVGKHSQRGAFKIFILPILQRPEEGGKTD